MSEAGLWEGGGSGCSQGPGLCPDGKTKDQLSSEDVRAGRYPENSAHMPPHVLVPWVRKLRPGQEEVRQGLGRFICM